MRHLGSINRIFSTFGKEPRSRFCLIVLCLLGTISFAYSLLHLQPVAAGGATVLVKGLSFPDYIAVDQAGVLYIADLSCELPSGSDCNIYMETPAASGNAYTQTKIADFETIGIPQGLVVDLQKNVYTAVAGKGIYEEIPEGSQPWLQTIFGCALDSPTGLAVGPKFFYVPDRDSKSIYSEGFTSTCENAPILVSGISLPGPIAVDSSGNIYVASGGAVLKETPSGTTFTPTQVNSGYSAINGIAVDSSANVYISDGGGTVYEDSPCSAGYSQIAIFSPSGAGPGGIALDSANNIYVTQPQMGQVWKVPSQPAPACPAPPTGLTGTVVPTTNPPAKQSKP